ncbi:DUF4019 domain-containing protein [Pseudomonas mangiferae]|uniref:DUF4019 domain-containing protein n=2 Tax=Pseudomonas mangiferae TaxID=2593654 RepID=A0A553GUC3_9PSED|nr:DUF4019 domain-containing protein [Pseudomonas mangiferae]
MKMGLVSRVFLIFLFSSIVSCSQSNDGREEEGEKYVDYFNGKFNSRKISEIYENASEKLKVGVSKDDFVGSIEKIREILGERVSTKKDKVFYLKDGDGVPLIVLTYNTRFTNGVGAESFLLELEDNRVSLHRYNINSDDLIRSLLLGEKKK